MTPEQEAVRQAVREFGDEWVIDGTKMWLTNGSVADVERFYRDAHVTKIYDGTSKIRTSSPSHCCSRQVSARRAGTWR